MVQGIYGGGEGEWERKEREDKDSECAGVRRWGGERKVESVTVLSSSPQNHCQLYGYV